MPIKQFIIFLVVCYATIGVMVANTFEIPSKQSLLVLQTELDSVIKHQPYTIHFGAYHVESGDYVYLNPDKRFPMASTVKVLFALTALDLVDQGMLSLDQTLTLTKKDIRPYSVLSLFARDPQFSMTLENAVEAMLIYSDNSATDAVFHACGGKKAVNRFLKKHQLQSLTVSGSILAMLAATDGVDVSDKAYQSVTGYKKAQQRISITSEEKARKQFFKSPKDTSTVRAWTTLFTKLLNGDLLSDQSTSYVLTVMNQSHWGKKRIKGFLPHVQVSHKTGSFSKCTNDVGLITLPYNKGHLIIAASVIDREPERMPDAPSFEAKRDHVIALLTKTVYDFWVFQP
ncbi:hypothetical protein DID76_03110 [Candidatus Marinamargulisbacteria bacterium SCGC AG-414-C22]|nr:hypothetical protein DID76_03110 [Candidatus Marinamargulisbacteria bacterium SCGC AG-414-C22]